MSSRMLKWGLAVLGVLGLAAGIAVTLLLRGREHAAVAIKAAATSGVIGMAAAPVLVGDKITHSVAFLIPLSGETTKVVQEHAKQQAELLAQGDYESSSALFWKQTSSGRPEDEGVAINALVLAALNPDLNPAHADTALRWLADQYSAETDDLTTCAVVAAALWWRADLDSAETYARSLLPRLMAHHREQTSRDSVLLPHVLAAARAALDRKGSARITPQVAQMAQQCKDSFPIDQVPLTEANLRLACELVTTLYRAEQEEDGVTYLSQVLLRLSAEEAAPLTLRAYLADQIASVRQINDLPWRADTAAAVLGAIPEDLRTVITSEIRAKDLFVADDPQTNRLTYRRLLNQHGTWVAPYGAQLLPTSYANSVPMDTIMEDHFELISYEVEAGAESATFGRLEQALDARNAASDVVRIERFLWNQFPAEPVGRQAFVRWAQRQEDAASLAQVAAAAQELRESYPDEPIAEAAELALAWVRTRRGEALEALLDVYTHYTQRDLDAGTVLSLGLLNDLLRVYQQQVVAVGFPVQRDRLTMAVADQLRDAGESGLAAALYWQITRDAPTPPLHPQTNLAYDPPAMGGNDPDETRQAALFWRGLALLAQQQNEQAVAALEQYLDQAPEGASAGTARLLLAEQLVALGEMERAWEWLKDVPWDLLQTPRGAALYGRVAAQVPQQQQQQRRQERIQHLRTSLATGQAMASGDRILMELADLLSQDRQPVEAAMCYEQLVREHPASPLVPEALYRAVILYRKQLNNPRQAEHLQALLKAKHPESQYLELLGD